MLKKLLKYDLRSVFRFWWIAVIICTSLSIVAGISQLVSSYDGWMPQVFTAISDGAIFLTYCSYFALMVLMLVLLFIRFFKNFFSDEGYLTFTLPVSRKQLLNSKVITGFIAMVATAAVCGVSWLIMIAIRNISNPDSGGFFGPIIWYIADGTKELGIYFWIYMAEGVTLALIFLALVVLFLYFCITFGSMIVKKGKLIASIAIFYGASSIFTAIVQFLLIFGSIGFLASLDPGTTLNEDPLLALFLLGLIFYLSMLSCLLYALQYRMLDKKLNLA